ncbi:type II toxin-antitoxin system HipA family toxin [Sinimarinibacterium sp. CAU 1509]|uniref:type II toxin-antitoxin system HipA family toxin n=1 Tax=Sinimarinibacterium sp. CAU 1509 TaxID=2562283 RepID=UPI0010AD0676|nr:type II toxin-antitoxin system HipA family toxin [Sinimarinibacterium sp. CAU 1509]TJY59431.1 type II toxin-antitoxin system HipA family toxin [Sinimarinibacterium sp. CAU 1509]
MLAVIHSRGRVGSLRAVEGALEFSYAPDWLQSAGAFPLSPRLALREAPWRGDEVLFFFANLLPEGAVLETLIRLRRLPRGNVYRLLEAFGRECAGAFDIVPEAEARHVSRTASKTSNYREYPPATLAEDLARLRDNIPLMAGHAELRLSLAGAQDKIPVRYAEGALWLPQGNAPSTHILKPALHPQKLFPDSVMNEAFCMRLAAALGLPAAAVTVLMEPEPVLLIERYDRVVARDRIERLHQLDLCQLAGVLPAQKYEVDGGPGFKTCFELIDAHSAAPARGRLQLVDWTLFNLLIGNADAHAKNLAMLYGADGRLRLAPAYDLLATGYWSELSDRMAMAIGGERRPAWVQARHWQRFCESLGLNTVQLRRRARDLCAKALTHKDEVMAALEVPLPLAQHLTATLERNSERIENKIGGAA